jgi:hypothetical protein
MLGRRRQHQLNADEYNSNTAKEKDGPFKQQEPVDKDANTPEAGQSKADIKKYRF